MEVNKVQYSTNDGQAVEAGQVFSGGEAQNQGLSPWADWADVGGEVVEVWAALPTVRDDGDPLQRGDTHQACIHGGSGTYQTWYVWDGAE